MRIARLIAPTALIAMTAACNPSGANYQPVVDGPTGSSYNADLAACQNLAAQQGALDSNTGARTAASAAVAAGGTALINNRGNNVRNAAIVGAAAGLASGAVQQQQNKETIVRNCMRNRGHNVVG